MKKNKKRKHNNVSYCIPGPVVPGPRFYNRFPSPIGRKTTLKTGTQHTLTVSHNFKTSDLKTLIYILTMTCFFHQTHCFGESLNRNIDIDSEEIEIINLTFLTLIGTQWYYEPLLPPPMPLTDDATKEDSIKHQGELRRINQKNENRKLDTSRLIVFFKDSLIAYPTSERQTDILEPKNFVSNFPVDSLYIPLIKKLYSQSVSKSIDLSKITEIGKYNILPVSDIETLEGNYKKIGVVRYSRIVFNESRDKACFYFDFLHGPLFGFGQIVFIEKKQGKWTIIGQREMWVA